jgi:hypothetical protein
LGKKKVLSEKDLREIVLPSKNDVIGIAQKMLGFDRVQVMPGWKRPRLPHQGENEALHLDQGG